MLNAALCALMALPLPVQELPSHPSQVRTPELAEYAPPPPTRVEIGGSVLLTLEDHSLPLVDGLLIFEAGALREPRGKMGLAQLWAICLREGGSAKFTGAEFSQWLDAHAVVLGIESTESELRISFNCLSEDLDGLLERIGELVTAPAFEPLAMETARGQLLTELERAHDDGSAMADDAMRQLLFGERSPFGRKSSPESVNSITREDLLAFSAKTLGKDRLFIGLSGAIDSDAAREVCTKSFAKLPSLGEARPLPQPRYTPLRETTIYVIDRPDVPQTELRLGGPGLRLDDGDQAALTLWTYMVGGGGMTNQLMSRVRTELGLAYGVGCGFAPQLSRTGRFYGYCATRNDAAHQALGEMIGVITASTTARLSGQELEAARNRLLKGHVFRMDTAAEILQRALALEFHKKPADMWTKNLKRLRDASPDQVVASARRHVPTDRFLCVAVGPADEIVAGLSEIGEVIVLEKPGIVGSADAEVEAMLEALGGRVAWGEVKALHMQQVLTRADASQVRLEEWRSFSPFAIRINRHGPDQAPRSTIVTRKGGWVQGPDGFSKVSPKAMRTWHAKRSRSIYLDLQAIAVGAATHATSLDAQGRIVISDSMGRLGWIQLGPDKRPVAMGAGELGHETVTHYTEWAEAPGGLLFAKRFNTSGVSTEVKNFEPLANLDKRLFRP